MDWAEKKIISPHHPQLNNTQEELNWERFLSLQEGGLEQMVYFDRVREVGLLLLTVVSLYSSSLDIYGTAVGQYLVMFTQVLGQKFWKVYNLEPFKNLVILPPRNNNFYCSVKKFKINGMSLKNYKI
jgi:hypothetical protein